MAEGFAAQAGLSQVELAQQLGLKYYTFISQVENGFGRVPTESMESWAAALGVNPSDFARELLSYYDRFRLKAPKAGRDVATLGPRLIL